MTLKEKLYNQKKKTVIDVVDYATRNIPFYMKYNEKYYNDIPIVNKQVIRNNYEEFLSNSIDENYRKKIINILYDKNMVCKKSHNELAVMENLIFEETTGTSGIPFRIVKSKAERTQMGLYLWKLRKEVDKDVDLGNMFLFNHTGFYDINPNVYDYNVEHIIALYKDVLEKKARWIHTSIVPLREHMKILQKENCCLEFPDLKYIELTGNYLRNDEVKAVEEFFQVEAVNMYGSMETWQIAYSLHRDKLKICNHNVFVEIIDEAGEEITEINKVGKIVVTCLNLQLMPLIRYDTGDRGAYIYDPSEDELYIELQEEREINFIKGIEGRKIGSKQFGNILSMARKRCNLNDLRYIQFVQVKNNEIHIYINAFPDIGDTIETIIQITSERLNKKFNFTIIILSEKELDEKKYEKENLFICKC